MAKAGEHLVRNFWEFPKAVSYLDLGSEDQLREYVKRQRNFTQVCSLVELREKAEEIAIGFEEAGADLQRLERRLDELKATLEPLNGGGIDMVAPTDVSAGLRSAFADVDELCRRAKKVRERARKRLTVAEQYKMPGFVGSWAPTRCGHILTGSRSGFGVLSGQAIVLALRRLAFRQAGFRLTFSTTQTKSRRLAS